MWSASSSTVISTEPRSQRRWSSRSSSRPGQATSTSRPARRAAAWGPWPTPPKITAVRSPRAAARGCRVACTWLASSRVGTRISARGRFGCRAAPDSVSRWTSGSPKARVLPLPVRPRPSTSRPLRASGKVACWIGNGASIPCWVRIWSSLGRARVGRSCGSRSGGADTVRSGAAARRIAAVGGCGVAARLAGRGRTTAPLRARRGVAHEVGNPCSGKRMAEVQTGPERWDPHRRTSARGALKQTTAAAPRGAPPLQYAMPRHAARLSGGSSGALWRSRRD